MRKIILVGVAVAALTSQLLSIDISRETSEELAIKKDSGDTNKKSRTQNNSTKNATNVKSAIDKSANVEVDFYQYLIANPAINKCVFFQKTLADFGVSSQTGDVIDVTKQNWYEHISKANANISEAEMNVSDFKNYLKCIGNEGANFAQTITNFGRKMQRQETIKEDDLNQRIIAEYEAVKDKSKGNIQIIQSNFNRELDNSQCVFFGELGKIKCGGIAFSFPDNTLKYGELTLTSPQNFYGVTGKMTVAINTNTEVTRETSNETQNSKTAETSQTRTKSVNKNLNNKKTISAGNFIPKP